MKRLIMWGSCALLALPNVSSAQERLFRWFDRSKPAETKPAKPSNTKPGLLPQAAPTSQPAETLVPLDKPGEVILKQHADAPEFKVIVVKEWRQADGSIVQKVRDPRTGEEMLLCDKPVTHPEAIQSILPKNQAAPTLKQMQYDPKGTPMVAPALAVNPATPGKLPTVEAATRSEKLDKFKEVARDAMLPSQRELAIEEMCKLGVELKDSSVVDVLIDCAQNDAAASVRACAVRCLGQLKVNTPEVMQLLQKLATDRDQRVQFEVSRAMEKIAQK